MKKLLAMALTLALCLGLAVPALAVTPPMEGEDYEYFDASAAYEAAHPEEIAALDVDALIATWGYKDMTAREAFLKDYEWFGDTVEEAAKGHYIDCRLIAQEDSEAALLYREMYPDAWAEFDADAFFQSERGSETWGKAEYMATYCLFTQEEFVDDMFTDYVEYGYMDQDVGYVDWDEPEEQPTLTLMVNGVASDVAVTAENGVSYADAAALRSILGDKAVPADATGNVAIRPAAEAAGWDVAWYGGGWRGVDQEIQLWDKAAFEAELADQFGPFNDLMAKLMSVSRDVLNTKTPISGHETVNIDLTRFSTLDGNKTYTLTLAVDYVVQAGVLDMTLTFDVSQLLDLLPDFNRTMIEKDEEAPSWDQLTQLLKAGKVELILDYDQGMVAWNAPMLALLDPELEGWHAQYLSGWEEVRELLMGDGELSFTSTLYAVMLNQAGASYGGGAESALADYRDMVDALSIFLGKDRFTTQNGKTTWTVTTQMVNRAMAEAMELAEPEKASFFKAYEIKCSLDDKGNIAMDAHFRLDVDGIAAAMAQDEWYNFGEATGVSVVMGLLDMDITASTSGSQNQANSHVNIHWNNVGSLDMRAQTTASVAGKGPRQITDLDLKTELWGPFGPDAPVVDELDPDFSVGIIGGADGPTAILTAH